MPRRADEHEAVAAQGHHFETALLLRVGDDAEFDRSSPRRLALVSELRQALERHEILVHFQPQLDLRTGCVVSAEALCRWQHPTRGLLGPSDFVGVVEQSGLVRPFTLRVLEPDDGLDAGKPAGRRPAVALEPPAASVRQGPPGAG